MNMEKEMMYEAPEIVALEVEVESGFAGSIEGPGFGDDGTGGVDLPE
jgi:hypothetical protein